MHVNVIEKISKVGDLSKVIEDNASSESILDPSSMFYRDCRPDSHVNASFEGLAPGCHCFWEVQSVDQRRVCTLPRQAKPKIQDV